MLASCSVDMIEPPCMQLVNVTAKLLITGGLAGRGKWRLEQTGQQHVTTVTGNERNHFQFDHVVGPSESQEQLFKGLW